MAKTEVQKVDLKQDPKYREHYRANQTPKLVRVPQRPYLMADGKGDPHQSHKRMHGIIETIYPLAQAVRAALIEAENTAYTVLPLEGLFWADDPQDFVKQRRSKWQWTVMISLPPSAKKGFYQNVAQEVAKKRDLPIIDEVRYERFGDGPAAQVMHIGPYKEEGPTIEKLHSFIAEQGFELTGKHHEIYIGNPVRSKPENLRTILRQPYSK